MSGLGGADDRAGVARIGEAIGNEHERRVGRQQGGAHRHDCQHRLGRVGRSDPFHHVRRQVMEGHVEIDSRAGCHVTALDTPPGIDRLMHQADSLDDECVLLVTRTAAPQEAPQTLNLGVRVGQLFVQRAALAASVSAVNAAASVTARSAIILRSISMPAALSPAMKRL